MIKTKIKEAIRIGIGETRVPFSGVLNISEGGTTILEQGYGYANRSEHIENKAGTRFNIASGSKIFTAVAVCQLVEKGLLSLDTRLSDCTDISFPLFDPGVTVHHLLTHSSGIPDYFDEEVMTGYEQLWVATPMYAMTSAASFLPLFQNKEMKFAPGERFSYSNAGFIVLGLIVEHLTGTTFTEYVEEHIFRVCGMKDSGYYRLDQLPERTAIGYIDNGEHWKTNIYSLPVQGAPDGGAFTTAGDMDTFWDALLGHQLLSRQMTERILTPQIQDHDHLHYGYGVWIVRLNGMNFKYVVMGYDPGNEMQSATYAKSGYRVHILTNCNGAVGTIVDTIDKVLYAADQSNSQFI
ncbi:serine hydrolase domain-containing protein [Paenibacillus sp. GCM10012307]|uniref:Serine hydrolase n=1 Tax=Paenibacillus roseus TaxID=2798579 RepID=A0A934J4E2_9BACL|nr:serine hydrolase [Paenibacillus roseus]MBJ6360133.1 serine hydrolase [Paenibacillus roseus]